MKLRDVVHAPPVTCTPAASLTEVARLMELRDVGSVVVLDRDEIVGMVTDRDLAIGGYAHERAPSTAVSELMSHPPVTIGIDADTGEAAQQMTAHGVRRLPVVTPDGGLWGVVSFDDLLIELEKEGDTLRRTLETVTNKQAGGWARAWD